MESTRVVGSFGDEYWHNSKEQLHRENGPAIEYLNGRKKWFLNNIEYSEKEFKRKMRLKKISDLLER